MEENKRELSDEDYENFYTEKHFGYDKPLAHVHLSVDGNVSYNAILYIPEKCHMISIQQNMKRIRVVF